MPAKPTPAAAAVTTAVAAAPVAVPPRAPTIREAIARRIIAGAGPKSGGNSLLDFILVVGALGLIGGGLYGLFTVKDIPKETLPIIASVLSFICGSILGAYAGYRWGASDAMKKTGGQADPPGK